MSGAIDLKKEKNLFETRVIEYQNGGASRGAKHKRMRNLDTAKLESLAPRELSAGRA